MKALIGLLVIFGLAWGSTEKAACSDDKLQILESCYDTLFKSYGYTDSSQVDAEQFYKAYEDKIKTIKGINEVCNSAQNLIECITDDIQNSCINIPSFQQLNFTNGDKFSAQIFVTNFVDVQYGCGKGNKVALKDFVCIQEAVTACENVTYTENSDDCDAPKPKIDCLKAAAAQTCNGNNAPCFVVKEATISSCYALTNCSSCDAIDASQNDWFDGLCTDDVIPVTIATSSESSINTGATGVSDFTKTFEIDTTHTSAAEKKGHFGVLIMLGLIVINIMLS